MICVSSQHSYITWLSCTVHLWNRDCISPGYSAPHPDPSALLGWFQLLLLEGEASCVLLQWCSRRGRKDSLCSAADQQPGCSIISHGCPWAECTCWTGNPGRWQKVTLGKFIAIISPIMWVWQFWSSYFLLEGYTMFVGFSSGFC